MFGLGTSEIIVIGFIGIIVLGPTRILELAKTCGKIFKEFKNAKDSFMNEVSSEIVETNVINKDIPHEAPSVYANEVEINNRG